jgi:CubicO group peptidase (beta-lactamase class C family)
MRVKHLISFLLIIMTAVTGLSHKQSGGNSSQSTSSHAVGAKTTADNSPQVDTLMARWSQDNTPGAAIIVIRDGRVLHEKGYGLAKLTTKERISAKTVFDIGSVSKPFTAMAVMILVERGKLNYTDTLSKFFPEFQADAQRITVRQLLNHTSGIFDYEFVWGESKKLKGNEPRTAENVVKFLAGRKQLRFRPGQRWEYSNSNYVLLAQIVSIVSRESFPQFVQKNIFQPLGMNDSFVYDKTQITRNGRATAYVSQDAGAKPADRNPENYVYGDGQVNTTVEDMAKWDQSLYTEKLVKASTLKEAFAPGQLNDGTSVNYGFGWQLGRYRGLKFVAHGGETDGFRAQITRFPEQRFTVILLSNSQQFTAPYAVANKIASIYLAENLKSPAAVQIAPERLSDYVGRYALYDLVLKISLEEGALWLTPSGQKRVKLAPVSDEEFTIEGSNGASSVGFNRNAQGRITCLTLLDQNGIILCRQQ